MSFNNSVSIHTVNNSYACDNDFINLKNVDRVGVSPRPLRRQLFRDLSWTNLFVNICVVVADYLCSFG